MKNIDFNVAVNNLQKVIEDYGNAENPITETCDLANELGIILGEQCSNYNELISEFILGFIHGVNLSSSPENKLSVVSSSKKSMHKRIKWD